MENDDSSLSARTRRLAQYLVLVRQKSLDDPLFGVDILRIAYVTTLEFVRVTRVDNNQLVDQVIVLAVEHSSSSGRSDTIEITVLQVGVCAREDMVTGSIADQFRIGGVLLIEQAHDDLVLDLEVVGMDGRVGARIGVAGLLEHLVDGLNSARDHTRSVDR